MSNTFSQIYFHFVFAVKFRKALIPKRHNEEVHRYISKLVHNRGSKVFAIYCMPDHLHMLVSFKPMMDISEFIKQIKVESNLFINGKHWFPGKFAWQEGYGVFSHSHSQINAVVKYINQQEAHHNRTSFKDEYKKVLKNFGIEYDEKYLFDFFD